MKSASILQIALPVPLYQNFEYLAPEEPATDSIEIGVRVQVPFGQRTLTGIVIDKSDHSALPLGKLRTVTKILDEQPVLDQPLLEVLFWVASYYQQPLGEVLGAAMPRTLRNRQFITPPGKIFYRSRNDTVANEPESTTSTPIKCLTLNEEQRRAYTQIQKRLNEFNSYLLAGVTGSGKTEVYLALAKDVIRRDGQVLILVPEIGLTLQLVRRIKARLGGQIAVMHSNLNASESAQAWLAASNGTAQIIVGTRSAVFLPFKNLGLIIVDEEHDLSFKQQEGFLYHARDIAVYRAKRASIPIILGSATPSFESQHNVNTKKYQKLVLSQRARQAEIPQVELIDMRTRMASGGLSIDLLEAIESELSKKRQVLLFLNRRGYAPVLFCQDCSWIAECSRCDARMTFYKKRKIMKCHYCLKEEDAPDTCPQCRRNNLLWLGEGTQRIENKLRKLFPDTAVTRIDRDSTRKKHALQTKLDDIHRGKYQIIIGTQMLSKGHDFPKVTLVGILNVDHGLFSTDFRAMERLAQLVIQVAGRAGRGADKGKVLLQTHQPEHPLLARLLADGYDAFSEEALKTRKGCALPPYTCMTLIHARARQKNLQQRFLQDIKNLMSAKNSSRLKIMGPIPALLARKAGMYQSQLILTSPSRKVMQQQLGNWAHIIQQRPLAKRVRWNIEVDPLEME